MNECSLADFQSDKLNRVPYVEISVRTNISSIRLGFWCFVPRLLYSRLVCAASPQQFDTREHLMTWVEPLCIHTSRRPFRKTYSSVNTTSQQIWGQVTGWLACESIAVMEQLHRFRQVEWRRYNTNLFTSWSYGSYSSSSHAGQCSDDGNENPIT